MSNLPTKERQKLIKQNVVKSIENDLRKDKGSKTRFDNLVSTTSVEVRTMQNRKSNVIHRSNQILSNEMWINRFPSILFHIFSGKSTYSLLVNSEMHPNMKMHGDKHNWREFRSCRKAGKLTIKFIVYCGLIMQADLLIKGSCFYFITSITFNFSSLHLSKYQSKHKRGQGANSF